MDIKKLFWVAVVFGMIIGAYGLYMYNLPSADVSSKKVDVSMEPRQLVAEYKKNESAANDAYLNKVVLVSGKVKSIENKEGTQNIFLEANDLLASVSCEMSSVEPAIAVGDEVQIKGQCVGYLMDVVLTKCVLVNMK